MSKKNPAWKKDVFDTQVRDRLIMGAINKDDSIEQMRADNSDLLIRFNDEQIRRNVRRIAKEVDKDGLLTNTTAGFGKDGDDEDDDSVDLFPATVTPSKKKGRFSAEEGHTDLIDNHNNISIKLPSIACLYKEPITEVKKCGVAMILPGGTSNLKVMIDSDANVAEDFTVTCTMNDDFEEPMNYMAESFPGISCLHPLVCALKDSLRDVRSNKKDKIVYHCNVALPARVQTSLHTREVRVADYDAKDGKRMQVVIVTFLEMSDDYTKQSDGMNFKL